MGLAVTGGFAATPRGYAANETISVGCIGTGGRCQVLMKSLKKIPGARMVAVCDVWDTNLNTAREIAGGNPFATKDYRALLDRKDIDAVLIGAPDHQHVALMSAACEAGKDVYVEKPLTHSLAEGARALRAQNDNRRIVQVGMQQRSMTHMLKAYEIVKSGQLGPIHKVHLTWNRNAARTEKVKYNIDPASVDWHAWLGPARDQPFDEYKFRQWRWFWDFGGGTFTDLMVHFIDVAHWYLDLDHPQTAVSIGDRFSAKYWDTPDTAQTLLEYPDVQIYFEATFLNARNGAMLEFMGREATLYMDRGRYEVHPERKKDASNREPLPGTVQYSELVLGKGPRGADFYDQPDGEALHISNWLECIRTRKKPNAPVEAGISAASAAHLANIALRERRTATWEKDGVNA
ncbi:MAG: Gfo/Idh/MocA family oxidoreductase [Acidobacteriaceae bacterium]|nr:Gfo/Idh/MocA family oxidoreductase [Acidobacteriaceae bacterium]